MLKQYKFVTYKLLVIVMMCCNYIQSAYAEDFTFTVPVNYSLTCNISTEIYATCAVFNGPQGEWRTENGDGYLMHQEGQLEGNIIGGNKPAYANSGAGNYSKVIYPGNSSSVNTQLQVRFNTAPNKNASDATHWKCWTLMVPTSLQNFDMYGVPGSASQYTDDEGYEERNCYHGSNVTVVQQGTLPTN